MSTEKFGIWKIKKNFNLKNHKIFHWKIWILENLKKFQFEKFQKIFNLIISKTFNMKNSKNFANFTVSKIIKFLKLFNFEK